MSTVDTEINVYCRGTVIPCLCLENGLALVLFSENVLSAQAHGIHVGDVISTEKNTDIIAAEVADVTAVRTVARNYAYQSRFLLAWDADRPSPVERVIDTITTFGGKCIGYLSEKRVLIVLHHQPLSFPSPPDVLIVPSRPHNEFLFPLSVSTPEPGGS